MASLAVLSAPLVSCTTSEEALDMMKRVMYLPNFRETRTFDLPSNTLLYVYTKQCMKESDHTKKLLKGVEGARDLKYSTTKWYCESPAELEELSQFLKLPKEEVGVRVEGGGGLFYISDDKAYSLPGGIGVHEIDSWVNKVQMPFLSLVRLAQYYEFCRKVLRDEDDYVVVVYPSPSPSAEEAAAERALEDISRFQTRIPYLKVSKEIAESLHISPGVFIVRPHSRFDGDLDPLKSGSLTYIKYEGDSSFKSIYKWMEANNSPLISYLVDYDKIFPTFRRSYGKSKKLLYVMTSRLNPYSAKYEDLLGVFSQIARQYQDQLVVAFVPNDDIASKVGLVRDHKMRLYGEAEVRLVDLNTLVSTDPEPQVVDCSNRQCSDLLKTHYNRKHKLEEGEITLEKVTQFIEAANAGTLPQYYEKKPLPKVNAQRLTARNFRTEVLESEQDVLLEVHGKYCPACIAFANKFDVLAGELQSPTLKVAKLCIDQNQVPELSDKKPYTPIFWLYKRGAKDAPVQYTGPNNADKLREFVEAQLKASA
jgi:hypothetical protein